jgi:cell division transport system permease protein
MKSDFTFAKDDTHRFLPWHIGIMVALATLLLLLVFSLGQWVGTHESDYSRSMSVILPGALDKLDEKTEQVKTILEKNKAIASVKAVSEGKLRELLTPWIGNGDALFDMPLPVILDITLKEGKEALDASALQKQLSAVEPTIELDARNDWAEVFASFVRVLQWLALILVVTILAAMTLMITFSARASLHLHGRTVNLLHGMGAEDGYIANQFQMEHFKIGLKAAAIGVICAAAGYFLLGRSVASINTPVLPSFEFTMPHIMLVVAMPLICAMIVLTATRLSVLSQLRKVL